MFDGVFCRIPVMMLRRADWFSGGDLSPCAPSKPEMWQVPQPFASISV